MKIDYDTLLYRAELAMRLGEVERATTHPDGITRESDTTHTVMLQLAALHVYEAAGGRHSGLDLGLLLRHALVHDLPEAICGDVVTIRALTAEERAEKERRELAAIREIESRDSLLGSAIENYEDEKDPESEWGMGIEAEIVHVLDKLMPRLTHVLDGGRTLERLGVSLDEIVGICDAQTARLMAAHPRCKALRPVLDHFAQLTFERMKERQTQPDPGAIMTRDALLLARDCATAAHPGLVEWLAGHDRGISSNAMVTRMTGIQAANRGRMHPPSDAPDFGRCFRLLEAVPTLRPLLGEMRDVSTTWARLVDGWDRIEACYRLDLAEWSVCDERRIESPPVARTYIEMNRVTGPTARNVTEADHLERLARLEARRAQWERERPEVVNEALARATTG